MYVCLCKGITDSQIQREIQQGCCSLQKICSKLGLAKQCGKCVPLAREIINENLSLSFAVKS